ncbi:MAG TPA: hypothetical protein GX706_02320, partial [Candidatus Moranbacteria bacterium]|nr:hypothetical protein [Candidatus Moranbacteria bacterium]
MKKVKMTARLILIAVFALTISGYNAFAQVESDNVAQPIAETEVDPSQLEEMILVSDVNFHEAFIANQEGNDLTITFSIGSGETAESNIHYSVELLKPAENEGEQGEVIERKTYEENFSLSAGEVSHKGFQYQAPKYLKGKYSVVVYAENNSGMILSFIEVGDVELDGDGQFMEMRDCYLTVEGEVGGREGYFAKEGVDIKQEEVLIANCEVTNHFSNKQTVTPVFKTTLRSLLGEPVQDSALPNDSVVFEPGEKKTVGFRLPQTSVPQAYEVAMNLKNSEDEIVSNDTYLHYILVGESATIQNVRLDKTAYQRGDIAQLSVFLTGSADDFDVSRIGGTENTPIQFKIEMFGEGGVSCIQPVEKEINVRESFFNLSEPVIANCLDPQVKISLVNEDGLLDEKEFSFTSTEDERYNLVSYQDSTKNKTKRVVLAVVTLLVIILLILLVLIMMNNKKRRVGTDTEGGDSNSSRLNSLLMFFLLGGAFFFFSAEDASAAKYCRPGASNSLCVTLNVKPKYCAGEANSVNMLIDAAGCHNYYFWGNITALGANISNFSGITHGTSTNQKFDFSSLPAGRHTVSFKVNAYSNCKNMAGYNSRTKKNMFGDDCTKDKDMGFTFTETFNIVNCKASCNSNYHGKSLSDLSSGNHLCSEGSVSGFTVNRNSLGTITSWSWRCSNEYGEASCWATKPCTPKKVCNENIDWSKIPCPTDNASCEALNNKKVLFKKVKVSCWDENKCQTFPDEFRKDTENGPCGECGECGTPNLTFNCGVSNSPLCGAGGNDCCSSGWMYRPNENLMSRIAPVVDNVNV